MITSNILSFSAAANFFLTVLYFSNDYRFLDRTSLKFHPRLHSQIFTAIYHKRNSVMLCTSLELKQVSDAQKSIQIVTGDCRPVAMTFKSSSWDVISRVNSMDYFPSSKFLTKPKLTKLLAQPSFCMPKRIWIIILSWKTVESFFLGLITLKLETKPKVVFD